MEHQKKMAMSKAAITYNAASDFFDNDALSFWNQFGKSSVNRLNLKRGMKVLDLACGSGASALPAAEAVGEKGQVVAVDVADNLLMLGRSKAIKRGLHNIDFVCKDMTSLDYPDASFDAIICVFGIFFVADMSAFLKILYSMLKPGGKLMITTWGTDLFAPVYDIWRQEVKKLRPDLYSSFNPWDRITEVHSVKELFYSAGIPGVHVAAENNVHPLRDSEDWWKIVLGSGFRWTIDEMEPKDSMHLHDRNIAWLKSHHVTAIKVNVIYAMAVKPLI